MEKLLNRVKLPMWLWIALLLPAILSAFSIYKRSQAESLNRAVSFAVEYDILEALASGQGITVEEAIKQLKPLGLNSVVLPDETISELISQGRVVMASSYIQNGDSGSDIYSLRFANRGDISRVQRGLTIRLQGLAGTLAARDGLLALPPVSPNLVRATPIGLNPAKVALATKNGLFIIARSANPTGVSARTVSQTLEWAHEMKATVFLPEGDQVLGRRDSLETTIETLRRLGMLYASAEFAKTGGDDIVLRKAPEIVVRLHSAQAAELDKLSLVDAVERYSKAARERNMRILLIRPFSQSSDQPLTAYADFLHLIHEQIEKEKGSFGVAKPFSEPSLPKWVPALIGLSILPAAGFVGFAFFSDLRIRRAGIGLLILLGLAGVTHIGLQILALLATLVFPVAAFLVLESFRPRNPLLGFYLVSGISVIGGLCVAGMLNGLPFYIKAQEFSGVKLSIFFPILIIGLLFLDKLSSVKDTLQNPITWGTAALGVLIVALLGLMIARTGNDSGVGASGGEMIFRSLLDRIMYVRPRTKEFLIGHPLLYVGIGMLAYLTKNPSRIQKLGGWTALVIMVGSMGQTSIVNTLTHLHIPVVLSLARDILGTVLGSILGIGLWAIVSRLLPKAEEA